MSQDALSPGGEHRPPSRRRVRDIGVRPRMLAIVVALVALAVSLGAVGVVQIRRVYTTYDSVVQREARLVKDVLEMKNALADQVVGVRGYIISEGRAAFLEPFYTGSLAFERELADARTKVNQPEDSALLDRIEEDYRRLRPIYEREIAFVQAGRIEAAVALVNGPGKRLKDDAVSGLNQLYARQERALYATAARADRSADRAVIELLLMTAAALLVGAVLVFLVWRLASALVRAVSDQRELASIDPLTDLANHRRFHERLGEEFSRARRHGRDLSLVLIDLDHFKHVNDLHGHPVGDEVLQETAARLRRYAREGDLIARVGGEEFAWLMPETPPAAAFDVAERARSLISRTPFAGVGSLTASAGICDLAWADTPGDLNRLADGALYWAKRNGRNVSVTYSPDVVRALSPEDFAWRVERDRAVGAIVALARAVDARDPQTMQHSQEVAEVAGEMAMAMGWSRDRVVRLREAALVHDVGKVGLPDNLLFGGSDLDEDQRRLMQEHAVLGAQIVAEALDSEQVTWVRGHHERFDGMGFPDGLAAQAISDGARILAVANAWDWMTNTRGGLSAKEALEVFSREAGSQFCPAAVAALAQVRAELDVPDHQDAPSGVPRA
jgi:diguanylate cyclase (GGDEF)-like protein/putative nucleotidyltransferase with HDIG domain